MKPELLIWGVGYIGFSDMLYYAQEGIEVIGIDIDSDKWKAICSGEVLSELKYWVGFDYEMLLKSGKINFTSEPEKLDISKSIGNLICVPTERCGEPWNDPLFDVTDKIIKIHNQSQSEELVVIIESTMIPGTAESICEYIRKGMNHGKLYFGTAPRRDWFVSDGRNLTNMPRVYGCDSPEAEERIGKILGTVCNCLVKAEDYKQAEMTKSVENAIRHVGITLANQLADAFPEINIRKVLELAATKWNVELYYPSIGIGGYCIPLSSKYLVSADQREKLSIFKETIAYNAQRPQDFCNTLLQEDISSVRILGICYTGNVKVVKNSVIIDVIEELKKREIKTYVHDALYSPEELKKEFNFTQMDLDKSEKVDCLILFAGHREYKLLSPKKIDAMLTGKKIIWDNCGLWSKYRKDFADKGITYRTIGSEDWR